MLEGPELAEQINRNLRVSLDAASSPVLVRMSAAVRMSPTVATTTDDTVQGDDRIVRTNVRLARLMAELSQDSLAEAIGVDRRHIVRWESLSKRNGRTPDLHSLRRIADATGWRLEWLYTADAPAVIRAQLQRLEVREQRRAELQKKRER